MTPQRLAVANRLTQKRGPDATEVVEKEGWTLAHNLLSITGSFTRQPFVDERADCHCLFNGEIYNWRDLAPAAGSDGEALIPLYLEHGAAFTTKLDGEFALALFDFKKNVLVLSTDAFATKPLWYAKRGSEFGLASYESALLALGFEKPTKLAANTTLVLSLADEKELSRHQVFTFDPAHQHKESVDDFLSAFSHSIAKRAKNIREKVFMGLSSGYDSGAITCELLRQKLPFKAYSILGREDQGIVRARHALLPKVAGEILNPSYREYQRQKRLLREVCEPFFWTVREGRYAPQNILEDAATVGLGIICEKAKGAGFKIYLSGQGADEILSDYRMHGKGLTGSSSIEGEFPEDLAAIFPWRNFYEGAQKYYIAKEEHVAGAYGLETRYPYLDAALVQEFLWLTAATKNAGYKYPLQTLFEREHFPYARDVKVGFIPRKKTMSDYIARFVSGLLGTHI